MHQDATPYHALMRSTARNPDHACIAAPASARLPWAPDGFRLSYAQVVLGLKRCARALLPPGMGAGRAWRC